MMNVILTSIRLPILEESCQNSRAQPRLVVPREATRSFYEINLRVLARLMTSTWLAISAEFSMFVLTSTYSLPLCKSFKLVVWSAFNSRSRRTCLNRRNVANVRELFKLRRCVSAAVPGHVSNSPPLVFCREWLHSPDR